LLDLGQDGAGAIRSWGRDDDGCWAVGSGSWAVGSWGRDNNGCWAVRSWGRDNNWCWGIRSWCWGISWGRCVDGLSRVRDISDVARVGIGNIVGDGLDAAIGKSNTVSTVGGVAVSVLIGRKVNSTVLVINSISVVVCWRNISVDGGGAISGSRGISWSRGWGVLGGGGGHGHDGEESNKALEKGRNENIIKIESNFNLIEKAQE
jgi:hypothetical protein